MSFLTIRHEGLGKGFFRDVKVCVHSCIYAVEQISEF